MSFMKSILFKRSSKSKNDNNNSYNNDTSQSQSNPSQSTQSQPTTSSTNTTYTNTQQIGSNNPLQSQQSDPTQIYYYNNNNNQTSPKRRTYSYDDYNRKRNSKKNKKQKRKKSSKNNYKTKNDKNDDEIDITNYNYNGVDDNDESDIHSTTIQTFNHNKSDTMVINQSTTKSSEDEDESTTNNDIIIKSSSLPLSPQNWTIHRPLTPSVTPITPITPIKDNIMMIEPQQYHPTQNSSNYSNYSNYSSNSQRPKLVMNHSIPIEKQEKELIIRTNRLNEMKLIEDEFEKDTNLVIEQLKSMHITPRSNIINMIKNGSYLPSSELKLYISKIKLSTYQLIDKIKMINEIITIFEDSYIMTTNVLTSSNSYSLSPEIPHIIFEYICNDFLFQAPFLRISLCDRIKKFYKTEYLKYQTDLIDGIVDSAKTSLILSPSDEEYNGIQDPRYRYYATIEVHIKVAIFWWNNNEFDRACFYVERSLKNCDMRDIRRAKLNYMLAHIYQFHIKKYQLSKEHYQSALKLNQTHGKSLFEYAYLLDKKLFDKENAKKFYIKHIELIENNPNNIIEYDIDVTSPKLSIFIGNGQHSLQANDSFVFKPTSFNSNGSSNYNISDDEKQQHRTLSQSISLSPKGGGSKYLNITYDSDGDTDLSDNEQDDHQDDETKKEDKEETNKERENYIHNKKVQSQKFSTRKRQKSSGFGFGNLTLAPINSAASMNSDSLKLSNSTTHSASKSYNRKFEDEESGYEVEHGLDLSDMMEAEKINEQKKQKALLSLEAIEEEGNIEEDDIDDGGVEKERSKHYKGGYLSSDDEGDIVDVAPIGSAIDEDYGIDIVGASDNEDLDEEKDSNKRNSKRTGIGTRTSVKNKRKIAETSRLRLAEIYALEGDNKNAKLQYLALLDHDPKNFSAILSYAHFLQYNLSENATSEFYYQKAIKLYTTSNIYFSKDINIEKGIEMFVKYCDLMINEGIERKSEVFELMEKGKETIMVQLHKKLMLEFGEILCDDDNMEYIDKAIECFEFILNDNDDNNDLNKNGINNNNNIMINDKQYHYDAYLELGRIYHHHKNNLKVSYEYFQKALPLNHAKQDWHLHFEISMLMSDDDFIYKNIKRPFNIAKDHAQKSLKFCNDQQDKNELIDIYKSLSLIV